MKNEKRKHENHVTLTPIAERFGSGAVTACFNDLGLSQLGFEHPTFCLRGKRSNPLRHRRGEIFEYNDVHLEVGM